MLQTLSHQWLFMLHEVVKRYWLLLETLWLPNTFDDLYAKNDIPFAKAMGYVAHEYVAFDVALFKQAGCLRNLSK